MRKIFYLSTVILFACLSAHASQNIKEEEPYSAKAATRIRNVSSATLEATDKCIDTTGKCIKTMGPALEFASKFADFIARFKTK